MSILNKFIVSAGLALAMSGCVSNENEMCNSIAVDRLKFAAETAAITINNEIIKNGNELELTEVNEFLEQQTLASKNKTRFYFFTRTTSGLLTPEERTSCVCADAMVNGIHVKGWAKIPNTDLKEEVNANPRRSEFPAAKP